MTVAVTAYLALHSPTSLKNAAQTFTPLVGTTKSLKYEATFFLKRALGSRTYLWKRPTVHFAARENGQACKRVKTCKSNLDLIVLIQILDEKKTVEQKRSESIVSNSIILHHHQYIYRHNVFFISCYLLFSYLIFIFVSLQKTIFSLQQSLLL